eukprot:c24822_g1_i1 orf=356-2542(+)
MDASMNLANKTRLVTIWVLIVGLCVVSFQSEAHYMRVSSRWLVRESDGERVKLACVNWAGHLETMLPEGLNRQPLYRLGLAVKGMGFNCVRLTFATYMFTDPMLSNLTVAESFTRVNLQHSLRGIALHNPDLLDLPLQVAFARVVTRLTRAGLLIIIDNHVSKPQWCCGDKDGNGFWGDTFFDANPWLEGLSLVASLFKDNTEVVGMSLRNELRGPKQNTKDWSHYMSLGANAVHEANPNLIIILSGLHYDTDLRFLPTNHLSNLTFQEKLVYEMHWYTSTYGVSFAKGNLNKACAIATSSIMKCGAFMASSSSNGSFTAPLFISEFGIDQRGGNKGNNRFINCFFAFMASMDLDWAYWPLQGTYYLRNGHEGDEEFYGLLNSQWNTPRNISLLARLKVIQEPWQSGVDIGSSRSENQVLFHPSTGLCLQKGTGNTLVLAPCTESTTRWRYSPQGRLEMENSYLCISSDGEDQFVKLATIGTEKNGPWALASVARLQFATTINHSHALPSSHNQAKPSHVPGTFDQYDTYHDLANYLNQVNTHHNPTYDHYNNPNDLPKYSNQVNIDHDPTIDYTYDHYNNRDDLAKYSNQVNIDHDPASDQYDYPNYDLANHVDHHYSTDDHDTNQAYYDKNDRQDIISDADDDNIVHDNIHIDMTQEELVQPIHRNPILCLDGSSPPSVTTKRCLCVQEDEMDCGKDDDPSSQWFVLISKSTRSSALEYDGAFKKQ